MVLYQSGENAAFELLYKRHSGQIFGYLKRRTSVEQAAELLQDIFIKLHKSRANYDCKYPFLPWVFAITRNTLLDLSKRAESKLIRRSNSDPALTESLPASTVQESNEVAESSGLLSELPEMQRQAIEYRYLKEWSFEKIAEEMQTTSQNIRQLVSRGLKKARLSAEKKEA